MTTQQPPAQQREGDVQNNDHRAEGGPGGKGGSRVRRAGRAPGGGGGRRVPLVLRATPADGAPQDLRAGWVLPAWRGR